MDHNDTNFHPKPNSLFPALLMSNVRMIKNDFNIDYSIPYREDTNTLSMVCGLYLYTNPPPMGYGTPATKTLETVNRAYDYNLNSEENKTYTIDRFTLNKAEWVGNNNEYPFDSITGNYHAGALHEMARKLLLENCAIIDSLGEHIVEEMITRNADLLTQGKQTWCPIRELSVPSAAAYNNMMKLFHDNGISNISTCADFLNGWFDLMNLKSLTTTRTCKTFRITSRYNLKLKIHTKKYIKIRRYEKITYRGEDVFYYCIDLLRSFCSYLKHGERGKLERRYVGDNMGSVANCIIQEKHNLQLVGINLSQKKTSIHNFGYGEYTSWYQDRNFIAQYGVETAAMRPQGKNPADDFYSCAKSTSVAQQKLEINPIGAQIRLSIGIDNVRRLWRVTYNPNKRRGVSPKVLFLSDGGASPWSPMQCHLEETSLRLRYCETESDKEYIYKVCHPENPFAGEPIEDLAYSKDLGQLVIQQIETPRTIFHYIKRSNRSALGKKDALHIDSELNNRVALEILNLADPTTRIRTITSKVKMADHIKSMILSFSSECDLSEAESKAINEALNRLSGTSDIADNWDTLLFSGDTELQFVV